MALQDLDLKSNYFSATDDTLNDFYIPVLKETKYYDRMASFFRSSSITTASLGFKSIIENDGKIRLLVNTELDEKDVEVLKGKREKRTDNINELLDPSTAENEKEEIRWQILGWMLDNDLLDIKICDVPRGGIFHPKIGILEDENGNTVIFSGSTNESAYAWELSIEDIDVFRSWKEGHDEFMEPKIDHFRKLWENELNATETYEVPDAIKKDIIEEKPPDYHSLEEKSKKLTEHEAKHLTTDDWINIIADAGKTVGGTHLAEEVSSIDPWPHQRIISDTLYSTYPKGFLLCDEVGLGKTIEAGLTLSRLIHTEEIQNALILAPANLVRQWQEELYEKFNLHTYRYIKPISEREYKMVDVRGKVHDIPQFDKDHAWGESPVWRFVHEKNADGEPVIVLASWHLARMEGNQEIFVPDDPNKGKVRTINDVEAGCRGKDKSDREGVWDIVFVDEAHKARRRKFRNIQEHDAMGTPNNLLDLLRSLKSHTQCLHLLTATPMQINSIELFDLLSLVGLPDEWDDTKNFLDFYNTRKAIQTVLGSDGPEHTGQTKLKDGKHIKQAKLTKSDFISKIGGHLGTDDREETKNYLLRSCNLLRDYDRAQDGVYTDDIERRIKNSNNRGYLQYLLRDENQYAAFASPKERRKAIENISIEDWEVVYDAFNEAHPIDVILNRYTRDTLREYRRSGLLDQNVPERDVTNRMIDLGEPKSVYEDIENYVQDFYRKALEEDDERSRSVGIVMTTYRQRMTSSFRSIRQSLTNRLKQLHEKRDEIEKGINNSNIAPEDRDQQGLSRSSGISAEDVEDFIDSTDEAKFDSFDLEVTPEDIDRYKSLLEEEIEALDEFIEEVQDLRGEQDPKLEQLRKDIRDVNRRGRDRVMVFTQFTDTLDAIKDSLVSNYGTQIGCYSGRGGKMYIDGNWKGVGKEKVKNEFTSDEGDIEILLCTEAASHGLNLQKCGVLINYDLPWNPMRVEQRIGRIDRIGQKYDDVWIYNYFYENTVETDIYQRLEDRVNIFHEYVGGMQPILSTVSDQIKEVAMEGGSKKLEEGKTDEQYDYLSSEINTVEKDKLNGWDDYKHPDIGEIEVDPSYPYSVPVKLDKIEETIIGNECLEEKGVEFNPIDKTEEDGIYRLEIPKSNEDYLDRLSDIAEEPQEGTLADKIITCSNDKFEFPVTFNTEVFEKYPSLRLFSYGDPLFDSIIDSLEDEKRLSSVLQQLCLDEEGKESNDNWLICGWISDVSDEERNPFVTKEKLKEWLKIKRGFDTPPKLVLR